jgi:hypothetical protein
LVLRVLEENKSDGDINKCKDDTCYFITGTIAKSKSGFQLGGPDFVDG